MTPTTKKDKAYQSIRQAIVSGELVPGEILNIAVLSEKFGTGKTPTREALLVLAFEGLIEPIPRSGYMITPITMGDVFELFHLRTLAEVEAIGLAVDRITEEDICALERNNRAEREIARAMRQESAPARSYIRGYELNIEFHLTIARAAGSVRLARLIEHLLAQLERVLARDPYIADSEQHTGIVEALKKRNRTAAQAAMKAHLEETKSRLLDSF